MKAKLHVEQLWQTGKTNKKRYGSNQTDGINLRINYRQAIHASDSS